VSYLSNESSVVSSSAGTDGGRDSLPGPPRPEPRGPLSTAVLLALQQPSGSLIQIPSVVGIDALADDDLQLALYLCYELHYRGLVGADPGWEWDPGLLGLRAVLERAFLDRLHEEIGPAQPTFGGGIREALVELIVGESGPSLSTFLLEQGTFCQFQEFCVHRSAYQLKEADPHTFAIPRICGEAKAAMVEIQHDEYGNGDGDEMHSTLFAATMTALHLDPVYGVYVDRLPGTTLATVNLVSMFALHRRWRGALIGHLAVFEMTSVEPMGRYSRTLDRMGIGLEARRFYDVHVEADVRHGIIALERMVTGLMEAEPHLGADLLFGAAAVLMVEGRFAHHLLDAWSESRSSLLAANLTGPASLQRRAPDASRLPPVLGPLDIQAGIS